MAEIGFSNSKLETLLPEKAAVVYGFLPMNTNACHCGFTVRIRTIVVREPLLNRFSRGAESKKLMPSILGMSDNQKNSNKGLAGVRFRYRIFTKFSDTVPISRSHRIVWHNPRTTNTANIWQRKVFKEIFLINTPGWAEPNV